MFSQDEVIAADNYEDMINTAIRHFESSLMYSADYIRLIAVDFYRKARAAFRYDCQVKGLKSKITLVRPTQVAVEELENDYIKLPS